MINIFLKFAFCYCLYKDKYYFKYVVNDKININIF